MKKNFLKLIILTLIASFAFNIVACDETRDGSVIKEASMSINYLNSENEKVDINATLTLYETFAPKTTSHLVSLFSKGYYDNTQAVFHNKGDYLILGSYKLENDVYKDIIYNGNTVRGEFKQNGWEPKLKVQEGSLVMLRDPDNNVGESKYNTAKATFAIILNSSTTLSNKYYTVFGKIDDDSLEALNDMADQVVEDSDNYARLRYVGDRSEETGLLVVDENDSTKYKGTFECYVNSKDSKYYKTPNNLWDSENEQEFDEQGNLNVWYSNWEKISDENFNDLDMVLIPSTPINVLKIKNAWLIKKISTAKW